MEALLVVDMQKDFCYKDGSLYVKDAEEIFKATNAVIKKARKKMKVVFTQDWHRSDDEEFKVWPRHCIAGTKGAEIVDELEAQEDDYFIKKRRYSAFFGTDLDLLFRELKIEKIYICGVVTNICVLHTAGDASIRGYKVAVIEDCTKALSDYEQEYAIQHMKKVFNAEILNSKKFCK
ncbi:MAG: isochorismatase family cysteine hydrolase [Archaeoglobaceae archaeon]